MKHDFEQRREKRITNAKKRALSNDAEAKSLYNSAKEMASSIPLGQPILVGHHSEKRDRNFRDKIHNKFGKSFEKQEKAKYYAEKAEAIQGNTNISSDDPQALQKLNEKLKSLQEAQDFMKLANKCIMKKDKMGFLKIPNSTETQWEELTRPNVMGYLGFASYSLNNNNANIRQVKKRIEKLEMQITRPPIDSLVNGVRIFENREANRLQIIFDEKPQQEIRKQLKSNGFRWSPSEGAWQRHISNYAYHCAKDIAENNK